MPSPLSQPQREDLRFAVREALVNAKTVALTAEMVQRRVERSRALDFVPTVAEVTDALTLIVGLGQAGQTPSPLGATPYFQATAAGILAHERGQ
jgi:hypothetical protein